MSICAHNNRAIAPASLPWRLLCCLEYGRWYHNIRPILLQSPLHGIDPRASPGSDVARWILGRLVLQLLPLVSNKHPISLAKLQQAAEAKRLVIFGSLNSGKYHRDLILALKRNFMGMDDRPRKRKQEGR